MNFQENFQHQKRIRNAGSRTGSLLLLCTLAAVTLSLGGLAILQSHSRHLAMTKSTESSVQARMASDALMQRAVAQLRIDPTAKLMLVDKESPLRSAYGEVVPISRTQSQVNIFLYKGAKVPVISRIIDTEKLTSKSKEASSSTRSTPTSSMRTLSR
ncbi:hypothetical protein LF1_25380 [Rubripirellula obstinata]|uniref:Uncharacterized protein n=1 Tax=Rubripirellula obstinata TaxID=406547 RepID=A0A5B1CKD4_9BACT|nr:hypothetical protein [Rubripirellula obstinata]KAA1260000.1 hypothetical protein LF1_25380 [Rubripirellula obstinata]